MLKWFSAGPPYPEVEGWTRVGAGRMEGPGNVSTDYDQLLLEQVLLDHEIPCRFYPQRPGEGMGLGTEGFTGVGLYVPDERYDQAARLAEELESSPITEDQSCGDSGENTADDLEVEENGR